MKEELLKGFYTLISLHPDWKYQLSISTWQTDFLRFYQSQINYNISKENLMLHLTLYDGKKSFSFHLDNPDMEKLSQAFHNAESILPTLPEDPDFVDVEDDLTLAVELPKVNNIDLISLEKKIEILKALKTEADILDFDLFGTFICNYQYTRIINSNGIDKQLWSSPIFFEVKAVRRSNQVTVLQSFGGEDFSRFDVDAFINSLKEKMSYALNEVIDIQPGEYDVILAPRCIAELMSYLSFSLTARAVDQKSSCFEGKIGQQVFPSYISIWDNPEDKSLISVSYNSEGHIYRKLPLIEKGIFKNFMCNNYYHYKTGLPKNGNNGSCLVLSEGDKSLAELISLIKKGLYISSLHYMNFINMKETSVTGLTRDGTFLIENGVITKVVNNLRYTEKLTRIFENIIALENTGYAIPFSGNYEFFDIESVKAPHVLVRNFNITSSTKTI